jgi:hypothetical protein
MITNSIYAVHKSPPNNSRGGKINTALPRGKPPPVIEGIYVSDDGNGFYTYRYYFTLHSL